MEPEWRIPVVFLTAGRAVAVAAALLVQSAWLCAIVVRKVGVSPLAWPPKSQGDSS